MISWDSREILRLISCEKRGKILDMGCGSGFIGVNLTNLGFQVTSADIDKKEIKDNKRKFSGLKNIKLICSDLFRKVPKEEYDYISFDIPFFPVKKSSFTLFLGILTTLFHTEWLALPVARKIFPKKALARRVFIEKFAGEAGKFLKLRGTLFINLFSDEIPIVEKHFQVKGRKELFRNYFIISASRKRNHQN